MMEKIFFYNIISKKKYRPIGWYKDKNIKI